VDRPVVLESSAPGGPCGRYSLLTCAASETVTLTDGVLRDGTGRALTDGSDEQFWSALRRLLEFTRGLEAPLQYGPGWFGYLGYELGRTIERLPARAPRDTPMPDLHLGFHDAAIVLDHAENLAHMRWIELDDPDAADTSRTALTEWLAMEPGPSPSGRAESRSHRHADTVACNFSDDDYAEAVARCVEYIAAGDIFQVNLSRRLEVASPPAAEDLYRALRRRNPATYAAYMGLETRGLQGAICSASPELFLRVEGRDITTRPIKGTCPRLGDDDDGPRGQALLESRKDNAELAMIVDLLRNDLGRVCRYGSIRVTDPRRLEAHPTVQHLVATISGRLDDGATEADLLRATFPGGSITGAPKIRAMEIIDEIETVARGVYTGCIGCSCAGGRAEWNIAIRTLVHLGDRALIGVGGGIVADSDPQAELQETRDKARGLLEAVDLARNV
jgi:para-aminobenzoate synthetase component 1